jgi:PAS domain S-box-containing protein
MNAALILVVDDDRDTRELYKLVFEVGGYRVAEAASVAEALHTAKHLSPNVVLTDWMLDDGDGFTLCTALRRAGRTRRVPIIGATGVTLDADEMARAQQLGCGTVLTKPVDLDALVRLVDSTIQSTHARLLRAAAIRVWRYVARVRATAASNALSGASLLAAARVHTKSRVALVIADDYGRYVAANEGAAELTGYDPDVLTTMSVADLTPEPQSTLREDLWNSFLAAGTQEGLFLLRRRDGQSVPARYFAVANIAPGLHLSALSAAPPATHPLFD